MSSTEMTGSWWVPGNRDAVVKGALTIDEQGRASLVTTDTATDRWFPAGIDVNDQEVPLPAVHGMVDGRAVTLLHCTVRTLFLNFGPISVFPWAVVTGLWLDDTSHRALDKVTVELEHLATWMKRSTLRFASTAQQQEQTDTPVALFTHIPPAIAVVGGRTVSVQSGYQLLSRLTNMGMVTAFSDHASFQIEYGGPTDAINISSDVRILQDLISFATGNISAVTSVRVTAVDSADITAPNTLTAGSLYTRNLVAPDPDRQPVASNGMAFTMEDFDFADFMPRWFALHSKFQSVFRTLLAHRYVPSHFLESQVLDTISAAEQTYRVAGMNEFFVGSSRASRARKIIRDALSSHPTLGEFASRIAEQVDGRVTLDERLRGLAERVGPVASKVFGGGEGFDRWLEAAKRSRNDIAHTGSTTRFNAEELAAVANGAKALVELTLLAELGLDNDRLSVVVDRHHGATASEIASAFPPPAVSGS